MKKSLTQTIVLAALAGAAISFLDTKKKGVSGIGDLGVDTSSPEYAQWYYNVYLPSIQRQGAAYQPGWNYQSGQQFNPYQYQQQVNNPYGYLMPQYQTGQQYSVQAQEQCLISGGRWQDTGRGFVCSSGGVTPYIGTQYNANPYQYNPYIQTSPQACSQQGMFFDSFTGQCSR